MATHTSRVQRPRTTLQAAGQGLAFVPGHNDLKNSLRSQKPVEPHIQTHMQRTYKSVKWLRGQLRTVPERTQSTPNFEAQQGSVTTTDYRGRLHPIQNNLLTQPRSPNEDSQRAKVTLERLLRHLEPVSMRVQIFQTPQDDTDNEYQQVPVSSLKCIFEQSSSSAQPASRRFRNDARNASGTQFQLPSQPQPQSPDDEDEDASRDPHPPPLKRWMEHYDGPAWLDETSTPPSSSSTPPIPATSTVENPASRLNAHSCLSSSADQHFEHAPPLALVNLEAHVQHHDSQHSSFSQPEIITDRPITANRDARLDALLVKARESIGNLQGSGSLQQSQKKRHEWGTAPPPLNIVQKIPTLTHAQRQAAANLNNNFEANTLLLQQHPGHQDLLWQREQEKQTPQKIYYEGDTRAEEVIEGSTAKGKGKELVGEVRHASHNRRHGPINVQYWGGNTEWSLVPDPLNPRRVRTQAQREMLDNEQRMAKQMAESRQKEVQDATSRLYAAHWPGSNRYIPERGESCRQPQLTHEPIHGSNAHHRRQHGPNLYVTSSMEAQNGRSLPNRYKRRPQNSLQTFQHIYHSRPDVNKAPNQSPRFIDCIPRRLASFPHANDVVLYTFYSRERDYKTVGEIRRYWTDEADRRGEKRRSCWVFQEDMDEAQDWVEDERRRHLEEKRLGRRGN